MSALLVPSVPLWQLLVRAGVVYAAVLFLLRLGGKRQVGQMGAGEFVAILLISNAVQNAMNGGDNSLLGGLALAAALVAFSVAISYLGYRSPRFEHWVQGRPTLLVHDGRVLHDHLGRERLTVQDLRTMLRHQGLHDLADIREAVLESDGALSVIRKSEPG